MKKQHFDININASREKVWKVLWEDASYRAWTSLFHEGSHAVTDWKEGSKVLFLSPEGDGMVSTIAANRPYEFMSFKHLGTVQNGVEDLDSPETRAWAGALENYTLKEQDGMTKLSIETDITEEYGDYFLST